MNNSIWNKRIPTLLGLAMITIGIIVTSVLVRTGVITIGRATPLENPQNVRITNVSATSFTVSYTTQAKVLGSLAYGITSDFGSVGFDDRDQKNNTATTYNIHYVSLKNLLPNTLYFFAITSGNNTYLHNNGPFQITTGPLIKKDPPQQDPASGKLLTPSGTAPNEAIVYLSSSDTEIVSTLTQSDGSFILPLNSLRNAAFSEYAILAKDQILEGLIVGLDQKSNITLLASQINPIPPITLSQDYDFTAQSSPVASPSAQTSFPSFLATVANKIPQILAPKKDERFSDTQPLFKGTAQPGEEVEITVHSTDVIQTKLTADNNGNWSYRPTQDLTPGDHTITIVTRDASGILKTIMRPFTVYAQGSQVAQSATPSATITPKPTAKISPSIAPTPITSEPTVNPTTVPTQTLIITPSPYLGIAKTKGGEPQAPGNSSTMILGFAAIITTSFGVLLFLFTKHHERFV